MATSFMKRGIHYVSVRGKPGRPVDGYGTPGPVHHSDRDRTAAHLTGYFTMNGIAAVPSGKKLIVAHAKFDTGLPPTASRYEVVLVGK